MSHEKVQYVAVAPDGTPVLFQHPSNRIKFAVVQLRGPEEEGLRHWWVWASASSRDKADDKASRCWSVNYEQSDWPCFVVPVGRVKWTDTGPTRITLRKLIPANGTPSGDPGRYVAAAINED